MMGAGRHFATPVGARATQSLGRCSKRGPPGGFPFSTTCLPLDMVLWILVTKLPIRSAASRGPMPNSASFFMAVAGSSVFPTACIISLARRRSSGIRIGDRPWLAKRLLNPATRSSICLSNCLDRFRMPSSKWDSASIKRFFALLGSADLARAIAFLALSNQWFPL